MTQEFDSAALALANQAYGLSGIDAAQQTVLDDGNVSQVLDVGTLSRRGRVPFRAGIFTARLENNHAVSGELQSILNPFEPDPNQSGFPFGPAAGSIEGRVNPTRWDIWLLGAAVHTDAGHGSLVTWAALTIDNPAGMQAMSQDSGGGAVAPVDTEVPYAIWTGFTIDAVAGDYPTSPELRPTFRLRLDPDEQLTMRSQATAASNVNMFLRFGIFPISQGQDAAY